MSMEIMSKVWKEAPYHGNKLLCLLACADWANDDGEFYPSYNTIGKKIRITRRSAIRLLSSFVDDGTVSKIQRRNKSTHSSNLFKIHPENFPLVASLLEPDKQDCEKLSDRPVTTKKRKVVTAVSLGSDSSVTRGSDSSVTHIHHVEPSLDTSLLENYPKADNSLERVSLPSSKTQPTTEQGIVDKVEITGSEAVLEEYPPTPHGRGIGAGVGTAVGIAAHAGTDTGDDFQLSADFGAEKPANEKGQGRVGKQPKNGLTASAGSKNGIPQSDHQRLMAAQVEITGQPILNGSALGKAIKTILGAYTVDQAIECLRWMAEPSTNWKGSVNWLAVQNYIGEYFRRQNQQQLKTNGGLNDKDVRGNLSETKPDRSWITRQKWFQERFGDNTKVA